MKGIIRRITGSMLHDLVQCERRVHHDLHTDPSLRDPTSEFVEMLWRGGIAHERRVLAGIAGSVADLREVPLDQRPAATADALGGDRDVILGAAIGHGDLLGMPDILARTESGWTAGDVKSGRATEQDGRRPRREYAVQVALYASILDATGRGDGTRAFVIGRDGAKVEYDLQARLDRDGGSIASVTAGLVERSRAIADGTVETRGALSAACKLCHWHSLCARELADADDPTLVAGVGRAVRDALLPVAPTVTALAALDPVSKAAAGGASSPVRGIGAARLSRFRDRARLLRTPGARPYALRELGLAAGRREIHLDIEADPSRDGFVYLHGLLERVPRGEGFEARYLHFFADREEQEGDAFAAAMAFLDADPAALIYYYSKYERTSFRALAGRHPHVASREAVDRLFDPARAIDLLSDVISPATEWPTGSLGIKTLARHLGFDWRDADASGANSIAWFDEYAHTGDAAVKRRILRYNEDDVRASAVVLDALRRLPVRGSPPWPPEPSEAATGR